MDKHTTFKFLEVEADYPNGGLWATTLVSTRKLEAFKEEHRHAYRYVEHLIEAAIKGQTNLSTSFKCSFSDITGWYDALKPDEGSTDPIVEVRVELQ